MIGFIGFGYKVVTCQVLQIITPFNVLFRLTAGVLLSTATFGDFGENPVIFPTLSYTAFITTDHFLTPSGIRLDVFLWDSVRLHGDTVTDRVCLEGLLQRQATTQQLGVYAL